MENNREMIDPDPFSVAFATSCTAATAIGIDI